jgi:hypothetical protein
LVSLPITQVGAREGRRRDREVEVVPVGHRHHGRARREVGDLVLGRVGDDGAHAGREHGGEGVGARVDPVDAQRQARHHLDHRAADMARPEQGHPQRHAGEGLEEQRHLAAAALAERRA